MDTLCSFDTVIFDLTVFGDEIIEGLNQYRMFFENTKIIILAPDRKPGDKLLADIFSLGIFNIVSFEDKEESLDSFYDDLLECITKGKSYKDASVYRIANKPNDIKNDIKESVNFVKEKIIIQKEIHQNVSKAIIGFMGLQHRIGTTHIAIVSAYYLNSLGYSVALVESSLLCPKYSSFNEIKDFYDDEAIVNEDGSFKLYDVDFYPNFNISDSYKLQAKNYNFILEDFGCYFDMHDMIEFDRCILQIVISGFKEWELSNVYKFFADIQDDKIKDFTYLFNFASNDKLKMITEGMPGFKNIFVSDYCPDPFKDSFGSLDKIFKGYIPEKINSTIKSNPIRDIREALKGRIFKGKES